MKNYSSKNLVAIILLLAGGCQQCLVESDPEPIIGFNPQFRIASNETMVSMDITIENFKTGFFGFTFQFEFDTSKLEIYNCFESVGDVAFFGESYIGLLHNSENILYGSFVRQYGQDLVRGSGSIATCHFNTISAGKAWLRFIPEKFYFVDDEGIELPHSYLPDYFNQESADSSVIQFEIVDGRIDIDNPGINDP